MPDPFHQHVVPVPQTDAEDILLVHQIAYEFYDEVHYRELLAQYHSWYEATAKQHQQELAAMRQELNLFRWLGWAWKRN